MKARCLESYRKELEQASQSQLSVLLRPELAFLQEHPFLALPLSVFPLFFS